VAWREVCTRCGRTWALEDRRWVCSCEGLHDLVGPLADPLHGDGVSPLARYAAALPPGSGAVDLGMAVTRLQEVGPGRYVKADYELPTGSFKDRGAAVMIGVAARLGVESIVVDSSGNAGQAAAAHAGAAGIGCVVYVPAGTAAAKLAAISGSGATLVEVPGPRAAAADAAQAAVRTGAGWYASHVHQPLFHHGVKTLAFELYEQLPAVFGGAAVPAVPAVPAVVVPAGNGTLVLGLWLGFGELVALGRMAAMPRLVAVQAEGCAPLAGRPPGPPGAPTVAAGIAIPTPPRAEQVRAVVTASGGRVIVVSDGDILAAREELAGWGHAVEPTGAVAWAGLRRMDADAGAGPDGPDGPDPAVAAAVVAVLTGR